MSTGSPVGILHTSLVNAYRDWDEKVCNVNMWQQTWPNTSCGHGGIAGQALTTTYVVVVYNEDKGVARAYSAGSLLYEVDKDRMLELQRCVSLRIIPSKKAFSEGRVTFNNLEI